MKTTNENWSLQNSYIELPSSFYKKVKPSKVKNPKLAVMLSIIPGGGQIYNEKYMKSIIPLNK